MPPHTEERSRTLLARLIRERHWTVEDFRRNYTATARTLGDVRATTVSERQAKRWVNGSLAGMPYPAACRVLERMFHCPADDLFSAGNDSAQPVGKLPSDSPTASASRQAPSPSRASSHAQLNSGRFATTQADAREAAQFLGRAESATSPEILALLWNNTRRLARTYGDQMAMLIDDLIVTRKAIFRLLDGPANPGQTRDLYFLGGLVCAMLAHASRDLSRVTTANDYQDVAAFCAEQAGHPGLDVVVRTEQAATAYWLGDYRDSARYAQLGCEAANRVHGSISVLPAVQEARAWAAVGDFDLTSAALDQSDRARERVALDDLDEIGGMMSCSLPEQLGIAAGTAAWLPDPLQAERAAETALTALTNAPSAERSTNSETIARVDLALARVRRRAYDGARDAVEPILYIPEERRVLPVRKGARRLLAAILSGTPEASTVLRSTVVEIETFCRTTEAAENPISRH